MNIFQHILDFIIVLMIHVFMSDHFGALSIITFPCEEMSHMEISWYQRGNFLKYFTEGCCSY